ncbi:putative ABC transporter ATP-binding protein YfiL [Paenibacillus sp. L3-i20]|nr:putative ABC transporter ATP-binding protein YfiL [Paenibacillus sp. L3-i20]
MLGPNGAGKSTTISMLSCQIRPTSGQIFISGDDIQENEKVIKGKIGVVPQEIALYDGLNAYENLHFFGSLYSMSKPRLTQKVKEVLERVGLTERAKEPVRNYSGGMKRRLNIAASILHDPEVLFMDEPTVGIDPQSRNHIYELIRQMSNEGMTILYTTHYMEEVNLLCDRAAIMDSGRILVMDSIKQLVSQVYDGLLSFELEGDQDRFDTVLQKLRNLSDIAEADLDKQVVTMLVKDSKNALKKILDCLEEHQCKMVQLNILPPTLETLFLKLTGKKLRE